MRRIASIALSVTITTASLIPASAAVQAAPTMVATPPQNAASPDAVITFFAGLPYDGNALEVAARSVSDPTSPQFRDQLSFRDASRQFGATEQAQERLIRAARSLGLDAKIDPTRFFARISGPVATWEQVMGSSVQFTTAQTNVFFGQAANDTYVFSPQQQVSIIGGIPVPSIESLVQTVYSPAPTALAKHVTWFLPSYAQYVPEADKGPSGAGNILVFPGDAAEPFPVNTGTPVGTSCVAIGAQTISGPNGPAGQEVFFTPDQISQAYGLGGLQRNFGKKVAQDVAIISLNGGFLQSDIQNAANCFGHNAPEVKITRGTGVVSAFINVDDETSLDLQTTAWVLKNAERIRLLQVTNSSTAFLDGYSRLLSDPAGPPMSASLSYGSCEQQTPSGPGWRTQEHLFALAGLVGTSLFVSSGDTGSANCQASALLGALGVIESIVGVLGEDNVPQALDDYFDQLVAAARAQAAEPDVTVSYPASSPWVTAVGATQLVLGENNQIEREAVWNDLQFGAQGNAVSTGGPSSLFARPWYQPSFTKNDRRVVPDVVALGAISPAMGIFVNGELGIVGGTSEASPMVSAAMAMISEAKRAADGKRIGFANPWLYRTMSLHPGVFRDVVDGANQYPVQYAPGSLNIGACCQAVEGYDAASGLGSINFARLAAVARR